ncbi:MAG: DNA repair protein RadA [Desulfomonilia bacterium]
MAKQKKIYRCSACDAVFPQWMGKCPQCDEWNTLTEDVLVEEKQTGIPLSRQTIPVSLADVEIRDLGRRHCSIDELDRVLGGGIVDGSLVLIGGDPGIGKSTIMLQMAHRLAASGMNVLYVSGEESAVQLKMRSTRLGLLSGNILVYPEVVLEQVKEQIATIRPDLVIIDSIQSVFSSQIDAPPGSVSQIRHASGMLMEVAKGMNTTVFVVGHVTKEGWIAGPKMLEHLVDTVLYFEGDSTGGYRILRAVKNRFGTTGEIGVFEMKSTGLHEVKDPSSLFIRGLGGDVAGSAIMATIEGSRSFLVEVQSLVSKTSFSMPRRITMGADLTRLTVLLAVLEKRAGIFLSQSDVVVNIAGGMKVHEPAVDLALVMSIASSAMDKPLPKGTACIGELGLNGEMRPVNHMESRMREAIKMGFTQVLIPAANRESMASARGMKVIGLPHVRQALDMLS